MIQRITLFFKILLNFPLSSCSLEKEDIKNNEIGKTERMLVEMNSLDTLRHFLALIYLQIGQIPPTFPPTLLDIQGLIFSELT